MLTKFRKLGIVVAASSQLVLTGNVWAAKPTVKQALELAPVQSSVEFDRPAEANADKCEIEGVNQDDVSGWLVRDGDGRLLRRFLDTNKDNKLDLWCYYKSGVEIYRDIDADFNGKADQYRWLGTAGTRWGIDENEDGKIDQWKVIAPEEAAAEAVAALREQDAERFTRLLLTDDELASLGLDDERHKTLADQIKRARTDFADTAKKQQVVGKETRWVNFGGTLPGVVAAGANGITKDIYVYENVAAVVEADGKHRQIGIGTLVRAGDVWRLVDLPSNLFENEVAAAGGFFFDSPMSAVPPSAGSEGETNERLQKIFAGLEEIERKLQAASPEQQAALHAQQADALENVLDATTDAKERGVWIRQFADTIGAAAQTGSFPDGVKRLRALQTKLGKSESDAEHVPYIEFRAMAADYAVQMQQPSADFVKVQQQWLQNLGEFVRRYPKHEDSAEAYLQLGMAHEFAGEEKEAIAAYGKIVDNFSDSPVAKKATGAKRRLESVGKPLSLAGQTTDGKRFRIEDLRGHVVVLHYWATWCEPCKNDMKTIRELQAKYAGKKFTPVGVNLDNDPATLTAYLKSNRIPWPQLFEEGGLDSRLSNDLGVLSLPTMLLIDADGRVVNRNIHISELEAEVGKLLR